MSSSQAEQQRPFAVVVGAGVIGLTSALALERSGWRVKVVSEAESPWTTSDVAAAVWFPFIIEPAARALPWARTAYSVLARLAASPLHAHAAGIEMLPGIDLFPADAPPAPAPWWAPAFPADAPPIRLLTRASQHSQPPLKASTTHGAQTVTTEGSVAPEDRLPDGFNSGWASVCPVVDMRRFMPWLHAQCALRGISITRIPPLTDVASLAALAQSQRCDGRAPSLLVNCMGLGAGAVLNDPDTYPVQGQIIHVRWPNAPQPQPQSQPQPQPQSQPQPQPQPQSQPQSQPQCGPLTAPARRFFFDEATERLAYIIPVGDFCVLGGTAVKGAYETTPDPAVARRIRQDCARIEPVLADAPIIKHVVGLRPGRKAVRLEMDRSLISIPVIHNYGHGGNGVTVCFGCAEEVAEIAKEVFETVVKRAKL